MKTLRRKTAPLYAFVLAAVVCLTLAAAAQAPVSAQASQPATSGSISSGGMQLSPDAQKALADKIAAAQTAPQSQPAVPAADPAKQLATLQKRMLDWAQLGYYRDRNAALTPPAPGEQRVVFFGDSITEFWGRPADQFFPGKPYFDRGISGQTTPQMVLRFHQDVVDLHPAVVIILAGTNDIAENTGPMTPEMTLDNFRAMAEMARANRIKIVVGSVPPSADFFWNKGLEPAPRIRALNEKLEAWCRSQGIVWVDYYTPLADANGGMKPGMSLDGTHPAPAGYAIMAPLAEAGIAKALAQ